LIFLQLGKRLLPSAPDMNRKQGFAIPLSDWLKGPWRPYFEEVLRTLPSDLFDPRFVSGLIKSQQRGYANTQRLFSLLIFELWRRHYRIALP
jgi:asparagine synthase (glutamine-hydrolysing)